MAEKLTVKADVWNNGKRAFFKCPVCGQEYDWDSIDPIVSQDVLCGDDGLGGYEAPGCGCNFYVEIES